MANAKLADIASGTPVAGDFVYYVLADGTVDHKATVSVLANAMAGLFTSPLLPASDDGVALGSTTKEWSDLFLASGGVINWANGNFTATHSSGVLTLSGRVASATANIGGGTNDAGVPVTVRQLNNDDVSGVKIMSLDEGASTYYGRSGVQTSGGWSINAATLTSYGNTIINESNAEALVVGPNGTTNPTIKVVTNTASGATGLSITNAAAGSGVTIAALSSGSNDSIIAAPKGTGVFDVRGTIKLGADGTTFTGPSISRSSNVFIINMGTSGFHLNNSANTADRVIVTDGGLFGIGGNTPTYALHIAPTSGVTAVQTVYVKDATASTGKTGLVVDEGAGQSTTPLFTLRDSLGVNGVGFTRNASGVLEVNTGVSGTFAALITDLHYFNGKTASFPMLKRSSTILQSRLADDSAFSPLQGALRCAANAVTGLTPGVFAATTDATIVITDGSGQDYRVAVKI